MIWMRIINTNILKSHLPFLLPKQDDLFLNWIVTCDKKWILYNNRKHSVQWLDAAEAPQNFPKSKLLQKKVMVTVWESLAGLIHHGFIKLAKIIAAEKYWREIDEMHQKLAIKQLTLVNRKGPVLLYDNARLHV